MFLDRKQAVFETEASTEQHEQNRATSHSSSLTDLEATLLHAAYRPRPPQHVEEFARFGAAACPY